MISPLTGGKVKEVITFERKVFKNYNIIIPVRYYLYEQSKDSFSIIDYVTEQIYHFGIQNNDKTEPKQYV